MTEFRIRPLHRQRQRRRRAVRVLDHGELAALLGVEPEHVKAELEARGLPWHEDSAGNLWACAPPDLAR
jgi:hypothetical protein